MSTESRLAAPCSRSGLWRRTGPGWNALIDSFLASRLAPHTLCEWFVNRGTSQADFLFETSCSFTQPAWSTSRLSSGTIPYRREARSAVRCNCHRLPLNAGDLLAHPNRARIGHGSGFCACLVSTSPAAGRGEPVPSATARPLPGTEDATSRPTPAAKFALIVLRPILPLAGGVVDRKTRHVCPLAPRRFSMVLAVKVETRWSTPDSTLFAGAAGDDGSGESDLGRRADRR